MPKNSWISLPVLLITVFITALSWLVYYPTTAQSSGWYIDGCDVRDSNTKVAIRRICNRLNYKGSEGREALAEDQDLLLDKPICIENGIDDADCKKFANFTFINHQSPQYSYTPSWPTSSFTNPETIFNPLVNREVTNQNLNNQTGYFEFLEDSGLADVIASSYYQSNFQSEFLHGPKKFFKLPNNCSATNQKACVVYTREESGIFIPSRSAGEFASFVRATTPKKIPSSPNIKTNFKGQLNHSNSQSREGVTVCLTNKNSGEFIELTTDENDKVKVWGCDLAPNIQMDSIWYGQRSASEVRLGIDDNGDQLQHKGQDITSYECQDLPTNQDFDGKSQLFWNVAWNVPTVNTELGTTPLLEHRNSENQRIFKYGKGPSAPTLKNWNFNAPLRCRAKVTDDGQTLYSDWSYLSLVKPLTFAWANAELRAKVSQNSSTTVFVGWNPQKIYTEQLSNITNDYQADISPNTYRYSIRSGSQTLYVGDQNSTTITLSPGTYTLDLYVHMKTKSKGYAGYSAAGSKIDTIAVTVQ